MQKKYQVLILCTFLCFALSFKFTQKWKSAGPLHTVQPAETFKGWSAHGQGRLLDVVVNPENGDKMWVASPNGGLFYTKNRGKKWKNIKLPFAGGINHISLRQTGKGKNELLVASNLSVANRESYSFGIYKTNDNGKSWDTLKKLIPFEYHIQQVVAVSQNKKVWIYAVNDSLFYHDNIKEYFVSIIPFKIYSIKLNPYNPLEWAICGEQVWIYNSLQKSFNKIKLNSENILTSKRADLAFSPDKTLIVSHNGQFSNHIFEVKNSLAINKKKVFANLDINRTRIYYDSFNEDFLLGGIRLYRYKDNKAKQISFPKFPGSQQMHDDIRAITQDPYGNIIIAHDGGISISENKGEKWFDISGCGLNITEVYDFDINNKHLVFGAQDLSSFIYDKASKKWTHTSNLYGDGGSSILFNNEIYVMKGMTLMKGKEPTSLESFEFMQANKFNPPIKQHQKALFYGSKELRKYDPFRKGNFITIGPKDKTSFYIADIAFYQDYIILAKEEPTWNPKNMNDKLYISSDAGQSWKDITLNFPALAYKSISSLHFNKNGELFATFDRFDSKKGKREKVFMSKDFGESWLNISYNLPNIPCNKLVTKDNQIILGNDIGAYILNNMKWLKLGENLPSTPVTQIKFFDNKIWVSTYGRGLWNINSF